MHNRLRMDIGCARSMTGGALVTRSVYYDALVMHSVNIKCTYARINIPTGRRRGNRRRLRTPRSLLCIMNYAL